MSKVEELKAKLFSKNWKTHTEPREHFSHHKTGEVMDSWAGDSAIMDYGQKFFMKTSLFKKLFVFSAIFFTLAFIYASYMFFAGSNTVSNSNIDISILGNSFTAGGEELPLQIGITNRNALPLQLVDLVVEYPRSSSGDLTGETERIRQSLGTIPSGAVRNENIRVVLFGGQGSIRPIKVTLEYRVEGSNAIFVKEKLHEVNINSTPMNLTIKAPTSASANQEIQLNIKSALNSTKPVSRVLMRVDYPPGFQFVSAVPEPSSGNNVWSMGDLPPGSEREVKITGKMIDVFDGEEKTFKVWSGSQAKGSKSIIDVVFNSLDHTIGINRPFVEAGFFVNGIQKREYAIDSRSVVGGEIRWVNNSDTEINDLEIRAKISGNAINRKSVKPDRGFYESSTDTIVWNKNYLSEFSEVSPGESGSVTFYFSPNALLSGASGVTVNPSANLEISIAGRQEVLGFEPKEIKNQDVVSFKVVSDVGFTTKALYYSGPFANTGPIPPRVEKETTYTIVWSISNSANTVSKGKVRSSLPSWAKFVGPISPPGEDLSYNSSSKEITWNVGTIQKGAGVTSSSREAAFRIAISPSLSQLGTAPFMINEAVLTGHDDFANVDIRVSKQPLYTRLTNDPGFPVNGEIVVE